MQGQLDSELDSVGHAQAEAAAAELVRLEPALLWSSDLVRARDTALTLGRIAGLDPTYDERLREFHMGERQGMTHDEYAALVPEEFERFRLGH